MRVCLRDMVNNFRLLLSIRLYKHAKRTVVWFTLRNRKLTGSTNMLRQEVTVCITGLLVFTMQFLTPSLYKLMPLISAKLLTILLPEIVIDES